MCPKQLIPVAQYVRMSTEDQQYSIANQQSAIQEYAEAHGYSVVLTYADAGKSGVAIKTRTGLRRLLRDVLKGGAKFSAILVYDISRWGRFQDTDEAAHYEFLCKRAGIPVKYCAEQFENDGTLPSSIMKALKRTMAAEYSRELGIKVFAGQQTLALLGYRVGGTAGYGLRRMMISADGRRKLILKTYDRKAVKSDRVILVPGPKDEVARVRAIFALASQGKSRRQIVAELARRKLLRYGKAWTEAGIYNILKNEKYIGCNVWGKTQKKLGGPASRVSRDRWATKPNAFAPIVEPEVFYRVQRIILRRKTYPKKPDEFLLAGMRRVLARKGRLTEKLLKGRGIFDHRTYCRRFGSVLHAYELIGYKPSEHAFRSVANLQKMRRLRVDLLERLKELFPGQLRVVRLPNQTQRQVIELDHLRIAVHICSPVRPTVLKQPRWIVRAQPSEKGLPALLCTVDPTLTSLLGFYVVPDFGDTVKRFKVFGENHPWLEGGRKIDELSQLYEVANEISTGRIKDEDTYVGDVTIVPRTCTAVLGGKQIVFGPVGSAIFNLLVICRGRVVTRDRLRRAFVGKEITEANLNAHICSIRMKLGAQFAKRIQTIRDLGYMYSPGRRGFTGPTMLPTSSTIALANLSHTRKPSRPSSRTA